MKPRSLITFILGTLLLIIGITTLVSVKIVGGIIPTMVGGALMYLGWRGGRNAILVFGHTCVLLGVF